ncbi:aldehyde:ferredoxin oxidoreductase [Desulfohalotomaculum tongense]|uniref:aldehyde ferredoxin oxidoreductase family protein n=1 Tax=Desulforadius tongensis TaxID=1216062 RepID=UPI00195BD4F1|nr:aldehyde ferredoxin oxidoreductase C-terminal domain-containing protein [Desulforadius tongensis]MBM7854744.1 aldehyde:ferredoxin oxidoreductase [Desulforadius tongensis]
MTVSKLKESHKLLAEYKYVPAKVDKGYTNKSLYVNLSGNKIKAKEVTAMMKEKFIGGRGFGLWYLWNAVTPQTKWNDPENEIIISPGPVAGITQYPGAGKSLVVTLSPNTQTVVDSNVGGYFGPLLKFSGWDALEVQGKAENDVVIFIDGSEGVVRVEEAPEEAVDSHLLAEQLTELYADCEEDKRNISVVSAGTAADNTMLGMLNFSFYDPRRKTVRLKQAGRGGIGTVLRDKKIKGIVVKFKGLKGNLNNPADFAKIVNTGVKLHKEINRLDDYQNRMRHNGTTFLAGIMNDYDLLPTCNFKFGSHPEGEKIAAPNWVKMFDAGKADGCWYGCTLACSKVVCGFELKTGPYKGQKVVVDGPEYETIAGVGSNCGIFDRDYILECNFYCDTYGIDTISFGTTTAFIMECYENGIINKEITGGLELNFGSKEAAMELLHQMARGEGFGKIAGLGIKRLKEIFVREYGADAGFLNDIGMEAKGLEYAEYVSKESLVQQAGFGLANKGPQHDEAWLIFMDMVNNQLPTFEDKAEALHYFPMFRTWLGLVGLCKLPWNDIVPESNKDTEEPAKIIEHVQNYVDLFNAVTGQNIDIDGMIRQSEGVYQFQRVFNLRMGFGTREYDKVPYRSMGPVTVEEYQSRQERYDGQLKELLGIDPEGKSTEEKIKLLRKYREEQYEKITDAVYERRGWTKNGVPKLETLQKFGMDFPELVELVKQHQ